MSAPNSQRIADSLERELMKHSRSIHCHRSNMAIPVELINTAVDILRSYGPADDARDAARYRWIRENQDKSCIWGEPHLNLGDELLQGLALDSAIDKARQSATEEPGK